MRPGRPDISSRSPPSLLALRTAPRVGQGTPSGVPRVGVSQTTAREQGFKRSGLSDLSKGQRDVVAEILLDGVTKVFPDGHEAVKDMSLEIEDGEFMILVGPSGCGKSTALRMIAGLEDITESELKIGGETVNDRAPKERDIAMVFQNYALYPHMTVRENMGFALRLRGVDKA